MILWSAMKRTISSKAKGYRLGIAKTADTAVAPAEQQPLALPGEGGTAALVKRLAHRLLDLHREINHIDKPSRSASEAIRTRGSSSRCPIRPSPGCGVPGRHRR